MTIQQTNKQNDRHVRAYYEKLNREEIQSRCRLDLDNLISNKRSMNNQYHYCPFKFHEQLTWLKNTFYWTAGKGDKNSLFAVRRATDEPPLAIQKPLLQEMFHNKFKDDADMVIADMLFVISPNVLAPRYNPETTDQYFQVGEYMYFNTHLPTKFSQQSKRERIPEMFQQYLNRLIPPDNFCHFENVEMRQQDYLVQWIAQRVQTPSTPPYVAVVLRGRQGTGKNFLIDNILAHLLGERNVKTYALDDLKKFTAQAYQTTLIHIEEMMDNRTITANKLKALVTQDEAEVDEKYVAKYTATKHFGIIISSNVPNPISIEAGDRRYFIPKYSEHMHSLEESQKFFKEFQKWLQVDGLQEIYDYLYNLPITQDFRVPPMTKDKEAVTIHETVAESKGHEITLWLGDNDCYAFKAHALMAYFKVDMPTVTNALRQANFAVVNRRWIKSSDPFKLWIHNTKTKDDYKNLTLWLWENGRVNLPSEKTEEQKEFEKHFEGEMIDIEEPETKEHTGYPRRSVR